MREELIDHMRAMRDRGGTAFLFITHDLAIARRFCDRLVVLHEGRVVEQGPVEAVLRDPSAAETRTLLQAAALEPRRTTVVEGPMRPVGRADTAARYVR